MSAATAEQPRSSDSPAEAVQKMPLKDLAKQTFKEFKDDEVTEMAAGVAYHAIFAIPPMIVFLITLAALVEQYSGYAIAERMLTLIDDRAPAETQELLSSIVEGAIANVSGGAASFGVILSALIAIWSGSNGVSTFIRAFNRAYEVEEDRSFVKKKLVSIGLTVLMGVLVILAFVLFVFGQQIGSWIAEQIGLGSAFEVTWNIARWPLAVLFIMFLLAVLYYLGPNVEQTFQWISPGSVVATVLWILIVLGFKFYVDVANPGSAYGTLGSVVVLLFFLYVTAIAFLIGAEVNSVLQRHYDPKTVEDLAENPDKASSSDARVENERRARELEQREGATSNAGRIEAQPTARPRTDRKADGAGFGSRVGKMVGSAIVAFALSKLRRGKERGQAKSDSKMRQKQRTSRT